MAFRYRVFGTLAAVPTWIAIGGLAIFYGAETISRAYFAAPISTFYNAKLPVLLQPGVEHADIYSALGEYAAVLLLLALPSAALFVLLECLAADPFSPDSNLRSPLGVWPGLPLAILGLVLTGAAFVANGLPFAAFLQKLVTGLDAFVFGGLVLALAAAAAVTGGRPAKATAVVAAPVVLTIFVSTWLNISSVTTMSIMAAPCAALGVAFAVAAMVSRNYGLLWWTTGLFAILLILPPLAAGFLTPTQAVALLCLVAVPVGLIVNSAVRGTGIARTMLVATAEVAALTAITCLVTTSAYFIALKNWAPSASVIDSMPTQLVLYGLVVIAIVMSSALTPLLCLGLMTAIVVAPFIIKAGSDPTVAAVLLVLAGLLGMIVRSLWGRNEPPPIGVASISMSPATWSAMIATAATLMAMTAAALFYLSLAPTR
jgi:hypothetical protein